MSMTWGFIKIFEDHVPIGTVARPIIFPCVKIISWLLPRVDVEKRLTKRIYYRAIAPFQPSTLDA